MKPFLDSLGLLHQNDLANSKSQGVCLFVILCNRQSSTESMIDEQACTIIVEEC